MYKLLSIIVMLTASCAMLASAEVRSWTNSKGKTIQAEMVDADAKTVKLKLANGRVATIPIKTLSKADQQWIKKYHSGNFNKANFQNPWPADAEADEDFEVTTVQNGPDQYIYETPHFKYTCDARIGSTVIKKLSQIFEATYSANKALPLNNAPITDPDYKFEAILYEHREDYEAAGGLPQSAGVQIWKPEMGKFGKVIVPFESLGLKKVGKGYSINYKDDDIKTLIHEITHQMMLNAVKQEAWFCEGSAEYVGMSPYRSGRINFKNNKRAIIQAVTAFGLEKKRGRNLGKDIHTTSLENLMTMSYRDFAMGADANKNYGLSVLLVYYFYHADGKKDAARIKQYIAALQEGKPVEEARKHLLDGRTWEELSNEIADYWKSNGITINFGK